jgi:hypothetical protein
MEIQVHQLVFVTNKKKKELKYAIPLMNRYSHGQVAGNRCVLKQIFETSKSIVQKRNNQNGSTSSCSRKIQRSEHDSTIHHDHYFRVPKKNTGNTIGQP